MTLGTCLRLQHRATRRWDGRGRIGAWISPAPRSNSVKPGLSVSVVADRPETADLLRRNSEQLQRDLSEAGYEGVELDFDQQDSDQGNRQKAETAEAGKAAAQGQPISYRITHTDAGLDIRI